MVRAYLSQEELQSYSKDSLRSLAEIRRLWKQFCVADTEAKGHITREVAHHPLNEHWTLASKASVW